MCIPFREQLEAKDQRIAELAEANEARIAEVNEMRIDEANEAARLQLAIDTIEAAGYEWSLVCTDGYAISIAGFSVWNCETPVEAAEAAAAWAESQKEAAHE